MISVCMATFNGEKYLREQIDSILAQIGPNDELVVSDDGSTDKTLDILRNYRDPRIKIYHTTEIFIRLYDGKFWKRIVLCER